MGNGRMGIEQWVLSLDRLTDRVGAIAKRVEDAYRKMVENPKYDSYADLSTAMWALDNLMDTIEGMEKYGPMIPKGLNLQDLQGRVASVIEMVKHTRKRMLQDPRYSVIDATSDIVGELNNLYDTLGDVVEHIGHGEE